MQAALTLGALGAVLGSLGTASAFLGPQTLWRTSSARDVQAPKVQGKAIHAPFRNLGMILPVP